MSHATSHGRHRSVVTFDTAARRKVPSGFPDQKRALAFLVRPSWLLHARSVPLSSLCRARFTTRSSVVETLSPARLTGRRTRADTCCCGTPKNARGRTWGGRVCSFTSHARSLRRRSSRNWRDHLSSAANSRLVDHPGEKEGRRTGDPPSCPAMCSRDTRGRGEGERPVRGGDRRDFIILGRSFG